MEDVEQRLDVKYWLLLIFLCACCGIQPKSLAATQGTKGQTSIASATISVHIPHSVQLIAKELTGSGANQPPNYCLSVLGRSMPDGPNYFRVNIEEEMKETVIANWLRLQNVSSFANHDVPDCKNMNTLAHQNPIKRNQANSVVLMLVPE